MGLFLGAVAVGVSALVVGAAISFVCDELSECEKIRQRKMQDEYCEYENRRRQEYSDACRYYENARRNSEGNYRQEISEYQWQLIIKRKKENKSVYDDMLKLFNEHYSEKKSLLHECIKIKDLCEKSIGKQQNTYVRFKSIKATLISLEEAIYKLQAYFEYLDNFKKQFNEMYESAGEIAEPFSLTLPKDYPYEGKVMLLKKVDFQNGGYVFDSAGYIRIEKSDLVLFEQSDDFAHLPYMIYKGRNGKSYLSLSRGMLKNSIGGTIGIDAEVKEIRPNSIRLKFLGNEYLRISISKKDLLNYRRKTPIGSSLHVYVKDYDFALNKPIFVSEKVGEGLSITQFDSIMMVQTAAEIKEFHEYLVENDLLDEDDEWRIAPIWDEKEKNILTGVKMQIGNQYAYKAQFEEIEPEQLILRYKGMLEKDEFISFDDVYVTTNVTVDCYSPQQIKKNTSEYEDLFEECCKLRLYLTSEFLLQRKMMISSPMSVYLDQWTEITNRLIELLCYGGKQTVSIVERNEVNFGNNNCFTVLYIDNSEEVRKFIGRENADNRTKFFIALQKGEKDKLPCKLQDDENQIRLKVSGNISEQDLLEHDFVLDLYSVAIPYAEKQHVNALSAFKEGRVVNEKVKLAVINVKDEKYTDNGYRVTSFFNHDIQTNNAQIDAVVRAFGEEKFFMIQGPPGTGKTTVIKELILQQLNRIPNSRILVVSQANVAVDNVLRGIVEIAQKSRLIETGQIVRCGSVEKIAEDIEEYSFENKYVKYYENLIKKETSDSKTAKLRKRWLDIISDKNNSEIVGECLLGCFQIIGATCVGLESRHSGLNGIEFDLVIIDEAGKALAGELLIPINRAKKVIIIGDHKQLPPVINPALYKGGKINYDDVVEEEQQLDFLNRSFFQRLYEDCPDTMKCMLNTQFRMPPVIADLVNLFYDGELRTGQNCYDKKPMFLNNNLIFVDMKDNPNYRETQDEYENGNKSGPYNLEEISVAKCIVKKIRQYYDKRIVIITPYKKQKNLLMKEFKDKNVWVNTIDAFQGDEENIVIYCTTRAKKQTLYFSDNARLNVAFSRARNTLIFLGSSSYLKKYPKDHILHKVSNYLENKACIINYEQWLKEDFDLCYDPNFEHQNIRKLYHNRIITDFSQKNFFDSVKEVVVEKKFCEACGNELGDNENTLCINCLEKSEKVKCKCCNRDIIYPLYDKYILKKESPSICSFCQEVECEECKTKFLSTKNDFEYIKKSGKKCLCKKCVNKYREKVVTFCEQCGDAMEFTYGYQKRMEESGRTLPTLCRKCKEAGNKLISLGVCKACGKEITQKAYLVDKWNIEEQTLHKECRDIVYTYAYCKECGNRFSITFGEKESFDRKGYELPKRCKGCRG